MLRTTGIDTRRGCCNEIMTIIVRRATRGRSRSRHSCRAQMMLLLLHLSMASQLGDSERIGQRVVVPASERTASIGLGVAHGESFEATIGSEGTRRLADHVRASDGHARTRVETQRGLSGQQKLTLQRVLVLLGPDEVAAVADRVEIGDESLSGGLEKHVTDLGTRTMTSKVAYLANNASVVE